MLQLTFKQGGTGPMDLTQPRLTIGRDDANDVVLSEDGVSGYHAEIQTENGNSFVVDLGSTNGTFVNGQRIAGRRQIKAWDALRFDTVAAEVVDTSARRPTTVSRSLSDAAIAVGARPAAETQVRPAAGSWGLMGVSAPVSGKLFPVAGAVVAGRNSDCDLAIDSPLISGRHARFEATGNVLTVKDLGSTNGTFVNGKKVTEAALRPGDEVKLDQVVLSVQGPSAESAKTAVRPGVSDGGGTQLRTAVREGGTRMMPAASARLVATEGAAAGKTFPLSGSRLTVGRTADNDIMVDDATVSSSHARLIAEAGGWRVEDAGSLNGTFVNDQKVTSHMLALGDRIRFGSVGLSYENPAAGSGTRLTPLVDPGPAPAARKGFPAWAYGLIGFLAAGLVLAFFLGRDLMDGGTPPQIDAKLQAGKVWAQQLPGDRKGPGTPLLADINGDNFLDIIVADANGFLLAMDGQEGKKIFDAEAIDRILAPPVAGDLTGDGISDVVVASNSGIVVALNGKGKTLWKSAGNLNLGDILNRPVLADLNADGIPDVILPTTNKGLVALDGSRGWELWNTADMSRGKTITSPVKADLNADGLVDFLGVTDSGHVLAVTSQQGKVWQLWEAQVPAVFYASPLYVRAGDHGLVAVATDGGGVIALNAETGRMAWQAKLAKRFFASPVAADANGDGVADVITVAENGDIHVLDSLTGEEIWHAALGKGVQASPALFDVNGDGLRDLFVLDGAGNFTILDMARGRAVLTLTVPGSDGFIASPVLGDVNNDGLMEVATASKNGSIVTYGINRTVGKGQAVWPLFLGNDHHAVQ